MTDEVLAGYNLNERQLRAVAYVKKTGKIANSEYQHILGVAKRTVYRDLSYLVGKGLFVKVGTRGKGTFYRLQLKGP